MNITTVVVLVLTLLSFSLLVWVEMNSRRNTRALAQKSPQPSSPLDTKSGPERET